MIVLDTDAKWKQHRRIMGPAMTGRYLAKSVSRITESIADLVSLWKTKGDLAGGRAFDVNVDMENATMVSPVGSLFIWMLKEILG